MQEIRDALTIETYEVHGRISIEVMDWAEFSQCQVRVENVPYDLSGVNRIVYAFAFPLLPNRKRRRRERFLLRTAYTES